MIWGRCIRVRRFDDGEVTVDLTTKASFAPDRVSSAGEAMAEGTPETPEEPKKDEVAAGEEEKMEGDVETKVEEVEEPDDTPVDLSEFWVKPDQVSLVSTFLNNLNLVFCSSRESICWTRNMKRSKALQTFAKSPVSQ